MLLLGLAVFALLLVGFALRLPRPWREGTVVLGLGAPLALAVPALREDPAPRDLSGTAYRASPSCRKCHPDHTESWRRTFHRTMTQVASPASVAGNFDGTVATFYGIPSRMTREGGEYFMETLDPEWARDVAARGIDPNTHPEPKRRRFRIDLTIGSHNYQQYASRLESGAVVRMPLAWHIREGRWVHMNGVFLEPERPWFFAQSTLWNINCVYCHNVKARPGIDTSTLAGFDPSRYAEVGFDTRVAELGIACEACHGPGEAHERAHASAARRWLTAARGQPDPTIVNPARLDKQRSAQVCGHCHSLRVPRDEVAEEFMLRQDPYTAGEDLDRTFHVQLPDDFHEGKSGMRKAWNFWPDGTLKRTSIEYIGLVTSPCYERGEMTCLSCHTLHGGDPRGQLRPEMRTNRACTQCHEGYVESRAVEAHTHHRAGSSGSECMNCHMPNIVWGLLRGMRTHRVISPSSRNAAATGQPLACNGCHLDRTLAWSAGWLERWYGEPVPALDGEEATTAASVLHLLRGDAAQRALAAWSFGWESARAACDPWWAPRYLVRALDDEYAAVRFAAHRSLKGYTGFAGAEFDYLAPPPVRRAQIGALARRLQPDGAPRDIAGSAPLEERGPALPEGLPGSARIEDLVARRDRTELVISE